MPTAAQAPSPSTTLPDWPLVQSLYAQGLGPKEISLRLGISANVIATRASRGNWSRLTTECASVVHSLARNAVRDIVDEESSRARKKLSVLIDRHLDKIPEARSWKHAASLQRDLEPLVRNAKAVYGWSEGDSAGGVQIRSIRNAVIVTSAALDAGALHDASTASEQSAIANAPAIDAECVPPSIEPPAP